MAEIPVDAGLSNKSIEGMNTEDAIPNEGRITYDIKFYVILPDGKHTKNIIMYSFYFDVLNIHITFIIVVDS